MDRYDKTLKIFKKEKPNKELGKEAENIYIIKKDLKQRMLLTFLICFLFTSDYNRKNSNYCHLILIFNEIPNKILIAVPTK